jgi:predicted esterase
MKYLIALLSLILISCQDDSDSLSLERYNYNLFEVAVSKDIQYGENLNFYGSNQPLLFDFYEPTDDTEQERPLVILAHDGGFVVKSKEDMKELATFLAESGYAVASINYRLIPLNVILYQIPPEEQYITYYKTITNAIFDAKAATRFFYKDAQNENKYKIDTNNIFIGGYSAGSIIGLHYAYWNEFGEVDVKEINELDEHIRNNGGFSGNSGNNGYSEKVKGIINISGAIFNTDLIQDENIPVFNLQGDNDAIIPYEYGNLSFADEIYVYGSKLIHERLVEVGTQSKLIKVEKGGHFDTYQNESFYPEVRSFLFELINQ